MGKLEKANRRTTAGPPAGPAAGWVSREPFGRGGTRGRSATEAVSVIVLNPDCGTSWSEPARLGLLAAAAARSEMAASRPTLMLAASGFFGYAARPYGDSRWTGDGDREWRRAALESLVAEWPSSALLAVGVDFGGDAQEQWWLKGGSGLVKVIVRSAYKSHAPLADRRVVHGDLTFLGFVCGEAYERSEDEFVAQLESGVDVVAISAHVRVNRISAPCVTSSSAKRWAFQRRFQLISGYAGASLSHARANDDRYVRDCDNWFVHRGEDPFPGERSGQRIVGATW